MTATHRFSAATAVVIAAVFLAGSLSASATSPTTRPVSVSQAGDFPSAKARASSVSASGRFVAFASAAADIVTGDTDGVSDLFIRDMTSGTTERVVTPTDTGKPPMPAVHPTISSDGRFVLFGSHDANRYAWWIFLRDREQRTTSEVAYGDLGGWAMSRNGRFVGFGDTRGRADVYLIDRTASGALLRGRFGDRRDDMAVISISNDGRTVLIGNETRHAYRIWKPQSGRMLRFNQALGDKSANRRVTGVAVSGNGQYVMFNSKGSNLVYGDTNGVSDVFVRDLAAGQTIRISRSIVGQPNGPSFGDDISGNGRFRLFHSLATNLVPNDTNARSDVFLNDARTWSTTRCDVATDGTQADAGAAGGSLSVRGAWVTFTSAASNLAAGDTNSVKDVYLRGPDC